jgi:hypothetical protein
MRSNFNAGGKLIADHTEFPRVKRRWGLRPWIRSRSSQGRRMLYTLEPSRALARIAGAPYALLIVHAGTAMVIGDTAALYDEGSVETKGF